MKETIDIIVLGTIPNKGLIKSIKNWKSQLFDISITSTISNLPCPTHNGPFLNNYFSDSQLSDIMGRDNAKLRIGIIYADLENNFYVRRVSDYSAIISIKSVQPFLSEKNISLQNFLKRTIYSIFTLYLETNQQFSIDAYQIPHIETRGCLFDLNGDVSDVIHNTEKPIICEQCVARMSQKILPKNYLNILKKELLMLRKIFRERIELLIKENPYLSISLSFVFGILIHLLGSYIYNIL